MLAGWKERLAQKRAKNKFFEESQRWKNNPLLQDCLQAMRGSCTVVPPEMHEAVITATNIALGEDIWTPLEELSDLPGDFFPEMVYIVWDEAHLPTLKAPWVLVKEYFWDIEAVSFDTFLVSETMDRILWYDAHGRIRLYSIA